MLPEDANWLMEDADSDTDSEAADSDAGTERVSMDGGDHASGERHLDAATAEEAGAGPSSTPSIDAVNTAAPTTPSKRHGTYFHHPERTRKRSSVGGVFSNPRP